MATSIFDIYKIGVGPSSSHTMGPMRAACSFAGELRTHFDRLARVTVDLYGSLALTGIGHGIDRAILLGLAGYEPSTVVPEAMDATVAAIRARRQIEIDGRHDLAFDESSDLLFHRDQMFPPHADTQHPNGMRFTALDRNGGILAERTFFSIGGGFIVEDRAAVAPSTSDSVPIPHPFHSCSELMKEAQEHSFSIAEVVLANEAARLMATEMEIRAEDCASRVCERIRTIWTSMQSCAERGMATDGILPGGLQVRRRARRLAERLREKESSGIAGDPLAPLDWVSVFAMAVNEENAAGGRVVTAPTNGAAGVVPAVALYYKRFIPHADDEGIIRFFLTSAAVGILYKENASISGAEVGCQGEVGVASSMAAAGLVAALDGNNGQIEHAAEIAMEHSLGMTCDPIGGLVQIPCIERNAVGAVRAIQAARLALEEPEAHKVSLDQVIHTMFLTGLDMQTRYKETSLAGLALNAIEC